MYYKVLKIAASFPPHYNGSLAKKYLNLEHGHVYIPKKTYASFPPSFQHSLVGNLLICVAQKFPSLHKKLFSLLIGCCTFLRNMILDNYASDEEKSTGSHFRDLRDSIILNF